MTGVSGRTTPPDDFLLDRNEAVPRLVGRHEDFLVVAGLAGTARDLTHLSGDAPHVFASRGRWAPPPGWASASPSPARSAGSWW